MQRVEGRDDPEAGDFKLFFRRCQENAGISICKRFPEKLADGTPLPDHLKEKECFTLVPGTQHDEEGGEEEIYNVSCPLAAEGADHAAHFAKLLLVQNNHGACQVCSLLPRLLGLVVCQPPGLPLIFLARYESSVAE